MQRRLTSAASPRLSAICPRRKKTTGWAVWAALLAFGGLLLRLAPVPVHAQSLPRLQEQVTDLTSNRVLAGGRGAIDTALADLLQRHNVQLFVLFVDSTNGRTATAYADETARANSFGNNDALLMVAVRDRSDAIWRGSASLSRLTDRELEDVLSRRVEPLLARGDFPGAVVAGAEGIGQVAGAGDQGNGGSTGGLDASRLLIPLAAGGGGLLAWRAIAGRRRQQRVTQEQAQATSRLEHEANALLIAADEHLRNAREEIGFAEAQFERAEVAAYQEAIARATEELTAAFTLRQQLDDAEPETDEQRRAIIARVTEHARAVEAQLGPREDHIRQLRDLERNAPDLLAALPGQIDAVEARIPATERTLTGMRRFAERGYASVRGNIEAARETISEARQAAAEGTAALTNDDRTSAGSAAGSAQQGVAEATHLLDAVEQMAASLKQAEQSVHEQIATATADIQSARAAMAGSSQPERTARLAQAEATLREAEQSLAAERPDVLGAVRLAQQAEQLADALLADVQEETERRARAQRLIDSHLPAAETDYDRVAAFISGRRRLIGSTARTRLAEAGRRLDRARTLAAGDPDAALAEVRRAQSLTEDAYDLAVEDVESAQPYGGGWGSPMRGGVVLPIPFPIPMGGGGGWFGGGGHMGGGRMGGGVSMGRGGGSVGGRW